MNEAPPQAVDLERVVLGALLLGRPGAMSVARRLLKPASFYEVRHGMIFLALDELYREKRTADQLLLAEELKARGQLDDVGGILYLADLAGLTSTDANLALHAGVLREKALARYGIEVAQAAAASINRNGSPPDVAIAEMARKSSRAIREFVASSGSESDMAGVVDEAILQYNEAEQLANSGRVCAGASGGFGCIDRAINGFVPGELTVLAARTKMGKTSLAMQMAMHAADAEHQAVEFVTTEMTPARLMRRMGCMRGRLNPERERKGWLSEEDKIRKDQALIELLDLPITIHNGPRDMDQLEDHMRDISRLRPGAMWVIDHMHRLRGHGNTAHESYTDISLRMKDLTIDLNCPVLLLAQLSRATEHRPDKIPEASDLRESGSIEENVDNLLMLYRPGMYQRNRAKARALGGQPAVDELMREVVVLFELLRFGDSGGSGRLGWDNGLAMFVNQAHQQEDRDAYE